MAEETTTLVAAPTSASISRASDLRQIDFTVEDLGKVFKKAKKRVTWKFRDDGHQTHEVVLIWSKRTGKQMIEMDGREVHYARMKGASIVTHQWTSADGMALHVLASRVSVKNAPNLVKYELMINRQAFTSLLYTDGSSPLEVTSLVQILYPDGVYDPSLFNDPLTPVRSTVDNYENIITTRNETTARRAVRSDGTAR